MPNSIAGFALRDAPLVELSNSLGRCFAEYSEWHGRAMFISGFTRDACAAGVSEVLIGRMQDAMNLAEQVGLLTWTAEKSKTNIEIASDSAEHQLGMAECGVKLAAIVVLHNACERFLYRLVRFGLVVNRAQALEWIADRKVDIRTIVGRDAQDLIDEYLQKWWDKLERDSLLTKWDKLIALVGYPSELKDDPWHLDREILSKFDDVRHNAVHHDDQSVNTFNLDEFAGRLWRAQLVWVVHVAKRLGLQIPAEVLFGLK